jgi:hypothetical protein
MKTNNKHIASKDYLSESELQDYLSGKLEGDELIEANRKISENEFYKDAVEGYQTVNGSINTTSEVLKDIKLYKFKFWNVQNFFFAMLIPTIALIAYISLNNFELKDTDQAILNHNTEILKIEDKVSKEIREAEILPTDEQISYVETINTQPETIERIDDKSIEYINSLSPHSAIEINAPEINVDDESIVNADRYTFTNFPIYYIIDLKTVDYRLVYKANVDKEEFNAGGVESKYENEDSEKKNFHQFITISYTYENFLQCA